MYRFYINLRDKRTITHEVKVKADRDTVINILFDAINDKATAVLTDFDKNIVGMINGAHIVDVQVLDFSRV